MATATRKDQTQTATDQQAEDVRQDAREDAEQTETAPAPERDSLDDLAARVARLEFILT